MKKQVKLKARETNATNKDFYNLFRPIAPSIDIIGKVAQVISALTEAITIWYIAQSEMAGNSKVVSIIVSIIATILVVALLELGGRKFLQVATRTVVWKRFHNAWYIALFSIVSIVTIGIGITSFRLSTNGINHAFVSTVPVTTIVDDSNLKDEYRQNIKDINSNFETELALIKENHKDVVNSTAEKFDAQVQSAEQKISDYEYRSKKGVSWAKSHVDKYNNQRSNLFTEKAATIAGLNEAFTVKVDNWNLRKTEALDKEKAALNKSIAVKEGKMNQLHQSRFKNAAFWGSLFSWFVGFSVILAFVCIVSVEVYRRGSGIEVEYDEEDQEPSIVEIIWYGITNRTSGFFRSRAERFAGINQSSSNRSIGFNQSPNYSMHADSHNLPTNEH